MRKPDSHLVYLDYGGEMSLDKLKRHLRLKQSIDSGIQVLNADEKGLEELRDILKAE